MKKTITMLMASIMLVSVTACSTSDTPKQDKKDKDKVVEKKKDSKKDSKNESKKEENKAEDKKEEKQENKQTASTAENSKASNTSSGGGNTTPQQPTTPPTNNNNQKPITPPVQPPVEEKPVTPPVCTPKYPVIGNSGKVFLTFEEAWNWADLQALDENSNWYMYSFMATSQADTCGGTYYTVYWYDENGNLV